jgi:hypothetical protein
VGWGRNGRRYFLGFARNEQLNIWPFLLSPSVDVNETAAIKSDRKKKQICALFVGSIKNEEF